MNSRTLVNLLAGWILAMSFTTATANEWNPPRYRKPAPLEDHGPQI